MGIILIGAIDSGRVVIRQILRMPFRLLLLISVLMIVFPETTEPKQRECITRKMYTRLFFITFLSLLLAASMTFAQGKGKGRSSSPPGWEKGEKNGWQTDAPPGLDESKQGDNEKREAERERKRKKREANREKRKATQEKQ